MALSIDPYGVYAYASLSGGRVVTAPGDFTDRGDYVSVVAYAPFDVVTYQGALYINLAASTGVAPEGNVSDNWSVLVLLEPGTPPEPDCCVIGTQALNLAEAAYDLALAGGGTISLPVLYMAEAAYDLAAIGTNVGTNAYNLAASAKSGADSAFDLAVLGTNVGNSAYDLAASARSGADAAFALAVVGTNQTEIVSELVALAADRAEAAYTLAVSGTEQAAAAHGAAEAAYDLAAIGTNVGTNAYNLAAAALSGANGAFVLAVAGTEQAEFSELAAAAAYDLAAIGTNVGTNAYNLATTALSVAQAGSVSPNGNNYRFENGWFELLNVSDGQYHPVYMYGSGTEATISWGYGTI